MYNWYKMINAGGNSVLKKAFYIAVLFVFTVISYGASGRVAAQDSGSFSLQVSPSPLVATVKPGVDTTLQLQIRNTSTAAQQLTMGLRAFSINDANGEVDLGDAPTEDIKQLITFSKPSFTLQAGEIMTQKVYVHTPVSAGFSYSFAITIAQSNPPKAANGKSAIAGTVAVFTLLNVDKPGASRKFELESVTLDRHVYEYLPANITLKIKNTGNVLVQPQGTVFVQRSASDSTPLSSLSINKNGGYVLPATTRNYTVVWADGYPHYEKDANGKNKLVWQGNALAKLRMGRYVVKVVAVYDDGQRDVPVMAEVSFWVIPWRLLLVTLVIILLIIIGTIAMLRSFGKAVRNTSQKVSSARRSKKHDGGKEPEE